jgi:CubicO group peptidase (beta-lactamase class C family)
MANAAAGAPNTTRTRFRLASLTKMFTAMAIMQLAAQHKLDVDDSICAYLDDCPSAWRAIAIHHLLTHTSGIPTYTDFADYDATQMQAATPSQLIARFRDLPLLFAPGTSYSYANSDYVLLGLIVERASGKTYAAFLREQIFEPLQMRDSGVEGSAGPTDGQAIGYESPGVPSPALDPSTLFAAGDLYSTVEDLYRWDQALYTDRLLPRALLDTMFTPTLGGYGYGWQIAQAGGPRTLRHPGRMDGFETYLARYPDDRLTVIVLSNLSGVDAAGIGDYLATLVLNS